MLKLLIGLLTGMKPTIELEVSKKIQNKEIAPNVIKMFGFFFTLLLGVFSSTHNLKKVLINKLPALLTTLSLILKDLLDEDTETTNIKDIDFELLS